MIAAQSYADKAKAEVPVKWNSYKAIVKPGLPKFSKDYLQKELSKAVKFHDAKVIIK